jgi:hypothetical protein
MAYRYAGQRARLSAAELNRFNATANARQLHQRGPMPSNIREDAPQSLWVWVRNDSGSDRSRFDCMALGDPIFDLNMDGSVDLLFGADTVADSTDTPAILIDSVADGSFGRAVINGMALAKVKAASSVSDLFAEPDTGSQLAAVSSGSIQLLAAPSTSAATLLPVLVGVGGLAGSSTAVFLSHSSGIAARSGATLGSASCVMYSVSGGTRATTGNSFTVYNDFTTAIAGSVDIIAAKIDGIWVAIAEDCT